MSEEYVITFYSAQIHQQNTIIMSTLLASLKVANKRSSSCSKFTVKVIEDNSPSPTSFCKESPLQAALFRSFANSPQSPRSPNLSSRSDFSAAEEIFRRKGPSSTQPPRSNLSNLLTYEDYMSTPEIPVEFAIELSDDEEIKPRNLTAMKEADLEASIDMVLKEMIASSNTPIAYPCHVSLKAREELLVEQPSVDIVMLMDIKNQQIGRFSHTTQKFMTYLSENDRLSLFTTKGTQCKRFPLRVMDEPTKVEFLNEFKFLSNSAQKSFHRPTLSSVFKQANQYIEQRKYKNHIAAILILTDDADKIDLSSFIEKGLVDLEGENPLVFAFGIGQKHDPIALQEICEHFEGRYQYVETLDELFESMMECLAQKRDIKAKNIKVALETGTNGSNPGTIKINRAYEKKALTEDGTQHFATRRSYFSMRDGINLALEIELSKCKPIMEVKTNSYFLELRLTGESLGQNSQLDFTFRKELTVKSMPPLLCKMPKQVDRRALESFYKIKVPRKLLDAIEMANKGCSKQSIQALTNLKKELYYFLSFKIDAIQVMVKNVDSTLSFIQSPSYKNKEKFLLIQSITSRLN